MERPLEIERKIRRLASAGGPGSAGRVLRGFGGRSLLATLLLEIDETILPRALRVCNDAGRELCLDAANRRLLQLRAPRPGGSGQEAVLLQPDPQQPETIETLRDLLEAFVAGSQTLRLRGGTHPATPVAGMIGVSARRLSVSWDAPMDPPDAAPLAESLDVLMNRHRDGIVAWQRRREDLVDCGGDARFFDMLEPVSRALEKRALGLSRAISDLSGGRCLLTLDRHGEAGHGAILAALDGIVLILLVRPEALAPLASALRELLHGWNPTLAA